VGINIEDTNKKTKTLLPIEVQCSRISVIKNVSKEMNVPLFINARTDVYIKANDPGTSYSAFEETLKRGMAYKEAGADCFYPITMQQKDEIKKVIDHLHMPVNILMMPGIAELNELKELGVARVSLGPSFLKIAIKAMRDLAVRLQSNEGLADITGNDITSVYLKHLVNKCT
jgi:2-methylisocitrate lyase-like PEP mutase family enzyme